MQRAQQKQKQQKPGEKPPQAAQAPLSEGCQKMDAITAEQLKCVNPSLGHDRAFEYATAASAKLGRLLGSTCAWAAFLGNAAVASNEMTTWKAPRCQTRARTRTRARARTLSTRAPLPDSKPNPTPNPKQEPRCQTEAPYCGRGPLQLTSYTSYNFCSAQPSCNCPKIADDVDSVSKSAQLGFGSAACVWADLFGTSLSQLADGSREGFLQTACALTQGKYPCDAVFPGGQPYERREAYWRNASKCLGVRPARANEWLNASKHSVLAPPAKPATPAKPAAPAAPAAAAAGEPKHRADAMAKVAALAATMEAAEAADRRRPLATPGVPRGKKKKKPPLPAKAVAMPVKAAPKPAKAAAKPAKAAQPAAEAKVAKEAKEARPAEGSGYAIEPDDPQLLKTLTSLGAQDTAQFAMVQKALKALAAHQEEREDANSLASLQP